MKHACCIFINCIKDRLVAETSSQKGRCYLGFIIIDNFLDICMIFHIFPKISKSRRCNNRLFKSNKVTLDMLRKALRLTRFFCPTIIGQAPEINLVVGFIIEIIIFDIPKRTKTSIIHDSNNIIGCNIIKADMSHAITPSCKIKPDIFTLNKIIHQM